MVIMKNIFRQWTKAMISIVKDGTYDELGEVITEPIKSEGFAVDAPLIGLESHPYGRKCYSIKVNNPKHSFLGVDNNTQM
jgi:hypothetical protein